MTPVHVVCGKGLTDRSVPNDHYTFKRARPYGRRVRNHMYFVRRVAQFGISLVVVLLASFAMLQLIPGDPVRAALGATAPAAVVEQRRADLGLNQPVPEQLQHYVQDVFTGNFGESFLS